MARRKFICGNWKMHKTSAEAVQLVKELREKVKTEAQVAVAPPFTALAAVKAALRGSSRCSGRTATTKSRVRSPVR